MPAKNALKIYEANGYYHVFNRGVEKRDIFMDGQDYSVFLSYLKSYLTLPPPSISGFFPSRQLKNYNDEIDLLAYCLMPNHFHFLLHQGSARAISGFLSSLLTRYSMYFNRKYERVGGLFQSRYKAVKIESEEQLVYVTHYIHRNPEPTSRTVLEVLDYRYSSIRNYLGEIKQSWVKTDEIMEFFSKTNPNLSYKSFVIDIEVEATSGTVLEV